MNQVPWLRSGTGTTPADGGCIMQVVDWIDRNEWTDSPPCVHPVLRRLAIYANDRLDDAGRQKLLGLAPRLMGTNSDDRVLAVRLAVFCAEKVLPIFERAYPDDDRPRRAIEMVVRWCDGEKAAAYAGVYVAAAAAYAAAYAAYAANYAYVTAAAANAADYAANAANASYAANAADYAAAAAAYAADYAAAAANAADAIFQLLLDCLDEHERLTQHQTTEIDWAPVCAVMN